MNLQDNLTKSLSEYILSLFGLYSNFNLIGKSGVVKEDFKTNTVIKLDYSDFGIISFPIYSATTKIQNSKFNVIATPIFHNDIFELAIVFKLDDFCVYGIKINSDDNVIFLSASKPDFWNKISIYDKLTVCTGLEILNNNGITWIPENNIDELYKYLVQVIEM